MVLSVTWRLYRLRPSAGRYDKDVYAARSLATVTYTMRAARCARSVPQRNLKDRSSEVIRRVPTRAFLSVAPLMQQGTPK